VTGGTALSRSRPLATEGHSAASGLQPGKLADFVLLGADPHDTDPDRIKEIPVLLTAVGGRVVHEA
jgi:hypothetical protein